MPIFLCIIVVLLHWIISDNVQRHNMDSNSFWPEKMNEHIYQSFYSSIFLSFYLSIHLYFYTNIFLSIYLLSKHLSIHLSFYPFIFLSVYISFYSSIFIFICLYLCAKGLIFFVVSNFGWNWSPCNFCRQFSPFPSFSLPLRKIGNE